MYNYVHIKDKVSTVNGYNPSGRDVVFLLRGLSRSYKGWLGLEEEISEKYDVVCVDLPGVGLSKNEKPLYKIEDIAEKFIEVINHLKLDNVYIVAPSLGSLVTYEIVRAFAPSRIAGLLIIVPSHSGIGLNRLSALGIKTLGSAGFVSKEVKLSMLKELLIGKTVLEMDPFSEDVHLERRWRNQLAQDNDDLGTKGQLAQVFAAAKYTSKKGLDYIRNNQIPMKVMYAGADRMIPISHKKAIYEYIKHSYSELIEMQHSGHDFVVTHKEQVKEVIDRLIGEKDLYPVRSSNKPVLTAIAKNNNKNIFFFLSTLIFGILLMVSVNKYKKKH